MNKKIIWTSLLVWTLLLTSCGTKPLGTFDEEMNRKQERLVSYIEQSFKDYEEMSFGKISSDLNAGFEFIIPNQFNVKYEASVKDDSINEEKLSSKWEFSLKVSGAVDEKATLEWISEGAWVSAAAEAKVKYGLVNENLYLNLDSVDLKIENKTKKPELAAVEAFDIKPFVEQLVKKWVKIEGQALGEEFLKAINSNTETRKQIAEFKNTLIAEIKNNQPFVAWEKTKFENKDAYKITLDEAKFKEYLKKLLTSSFELAKKSNPYLDEEIQKSMISSIDSLKIKEQEGYLVRTGKDDIDIIFTKLVFGNETENFFKSSFGLLSNGVKFTLEPLGEQYKEGENVFVFNITTKEGEISFKDKWTETFNLTYKDGKAEIKSEELAWNMNFTKSSFSGEFKLPKKEENSIKVKWDFKISKNEFKISAEADIVAKELKDKKIDSAKVKVNISSKATKNDKIVIDEKAIIGEEKTISLQEMGKTLSEMFPALWGMTQFSGNNTIEVVDLENIEAVEVEASTWATE